MKTVFTDDKGKYSTAVYDCEVFDIVVDEAWVSQLWPVQFGHSVSMFNFTPRPHGARWFFLISNTTQTTRADIIARLNKAGVPSHTVRVAAAVPGRGQAARTGTPRAGTQRALPNEPHAGNGLVAR